jgi:hypothetical protein
MVRTTFELSQELERSLDEVPVKLEHAAVPGVGIDDEPAVVFDAAPLGASAVVIACLLVQAGLEAPAHRRAAGRRLKADGIDGAGVAAVSPTPA